MPARRRTCLGLCLALALLALAAAQRRPLFPRGDYGRGGLCPYLHRVVADLPGHVGTSGQPASLCGNLCASDHECPDKQKCCPTHCGFVCHDPVYIVH